MKEPIHTKLKPISYPPKILVAWKEALSRNRDIRDWLIKNGYKELGMFCFALNNDQKAKQWLLDNGYAHLLATINAAEGDETAMIWLKTGKFDFLYHIARSIEGYEDSKFWLKTKDKLLLAIALQMELVKDEIDMNNNDPHKINP